MAGVAGGILYAADLDGTLLNDQARLSPTSRAILVELMGLTGIGLLRSPGWAYTPARRWAQTGPIPAREERMVTVPWAQ